MAKMFYTIEETKAALGRNEEGIKQLTREGRLREFRDGPRLMFKADQVEQLKGEIGSAGDAVSLAPNESGAPLSLAGDSRHGSTGGGLSLADSSADSHSPGDTQFADIGLTGSLSGSVGGVPSPGKTGSPAGGSGVLNLGGSGSGSGLSSHGTRGGITVFDVDDSQRVDPSAQTAINPNVQDQINLEGVGSGSGLLDLTRESDDTSLGAVFDELQPGQSGAPARRTPVGPAPVSIQSHMGSEAGLSAIDRTPTRQSAPPIYVEAADPFASALGGAALAVVAILVFAGFLLGAVLSGYRPEILNSLRLEGQGAQGMMYLAVAVAATVIFGVIGFVVGKMAK